MGNNWELKFSYGLASVLTFGGFFGYRPDLAAAAGIIVMAIAGFSRRLDAIEAKLNASNKEIGL